ncbi:hypothetical protein EDB85DRAFT_744777 [Lactarius pseudohatsudake]|nr:hypothetical protein EDB85DRAFT_744777 [Lactarius pseudohatsudake]
MAPNHQQRAKASGTSATAKISAKRSYQRQEPSRAHGKQKIGASRQKNIRRPGTRTSARESTAWPLRNTKPLSTSSPLPCTSRTWLRHGRSSKRISMLECPRRTPFALTRKVMSPRYITARNLPSRFRFNFHASYGTTTRFAGTLTPNMSPRMLPYPVQMMKSFLLVGDRRLPRASAHIGSHSSLVAARPCLLLHHPVGFCSWSTIHFLRFSPGYCISRRSALPDPCS